MPKGYDARRRKRQRYIIRTLMQRYSVTDHVMNEKVNIKSSDELREEVYNSGEDVIVVDELDDVKRGEILWDSRGRGSLRRWYDESND